MTTLRQHGVDSHGSSEKGWCLQLWEFRRISWRVNYWRMLRNVNDQGWAGWETLEVELASWAKGWEEKAQGIDRKNSHAWKREARWVNGKPILNISIHFLWCSAARAENSSEPSHRERPSPERSDGQQKVKSFGEPEAEQRKTNLPKQVKLKFWGC